jgi:hypothetical protein
MGKRKGKRKRERIFQPTGPGGFGPEGASASGRARFRPTWPSRAGRRQGNGAAARARTPERGGGKGTALTAQREGRGLDRGPVGGQPRDSSPPSVRFCGGKMVAKHGRAMGVTGVGRISPAGAYGGWSAARWRVPAAVMPAVRLPATIAWGKWRPVTVRV